MKDLIILTDKPITSESCSNLIKNIFKKLLVRNDNQEILYMKKEGIGFELWFTPKDVLDDPDCLMEDTIDKCPNKKAFLTNLSYTSKNVARKIIEVLEPLYGNMWIQSDEEDNWFGTASDFINNYCK